MAEQRGGRATGAESGAGEHRDVQVLANQQDANGQHVRRARRDIGADSGTQLETELQRAAHHAALQPAGAALAGALAIIVPAFVHADLGAAYRSPREQRGNLWKVGVPVAISAGWLDVLVQMEEVVGVVPALDLGQPREVAAVVVLDPGLVVVGHEVDITARL